MTREEIIKKTGIPRGSFNHWCNAAGVKPKGELFKKPGSNYMMFDYPDDAIKKISKAFNESRLLRGDK